MPLGLQQLVEMARVLFSGARIIILDEPTSALSPPEVERLFGLLRRLRDAGRSIVFISHFLDDVLAICDRVTVFRNGQQSRPKHVRTIDKRWIIDRMIGAGHEELEESYLADIPLHSRRDAQVVLQIARTEPRRCLSMTCRLQCGRARCWAFTASSAQASSNWPARCSACLPAERGQIIARWAPGAPVVRRRVRGAPEWRSCRRAGV